MALIHVVVALSVCAVGVYSQTTCNCVSSCNNVRAGKYQSCAANCGWARCYYPALLISGTCKTGKYWDDNNAKCLLGDGSLCPKTLVPCQNGGTCQPVELGYQCVCPPTATGNLCQTKIGLCVNNPCVAGATCVDTTVNGKASFTCQCPANSPPGCQNYPNPCDSNPCLNGGACYSNGTSFTCSCANGFGGPTCKDVITACSGAPCLNGGTCTLANNDDGFVCKCTQDYGTSATYCDTPVDGCANPTNPCQNGATCFSQLANYSCTCAAGWTGTTCATAVQPCASSPCQNGGTCTASGSTSYTCTCAAGFSGAQCQSKSAVCTSNPCAGKQCCTTTTGYTCQ